MLRAEDNKFLTESGAGTPMGELLRRFWLPVLLLTVFAQRQIVAGLTAGAVKGG